MFDFFKNIYNNREDPKHSFHFEIELHNIDRFQCFEIRDHLTYDKSYMLYFNWD